MRLQFLRGSDAIVQILESEGDSNRKDQTHSKGHRELVQHEGRNEDVGGHVRQGVRLGQAPHAHEEADIVPVIADLPVHEQADGAFGLFGRLLQDAGTFAEHIDGIGRG